MEMEDKWNQGLFTVAMLKTWADEIQMSKVLAAVR